MSVVVQSFEREGVAFRIEQIESGSFEIYADGQCIAWLAEVADAGMAVGDHLKYLNAQRKVSDLGWKAPLIEALPDAHFRFFKKDARSKKAAGTAFLAAQKAECKTVAVKYLKQTWTWFGPRDFDFIARHGDDAKATVLVGKAMARAKAPHA